MQKRKDKAYLVQGFHVGNVNEEEFNTDFQGMPNSESAAVLLLRELKAPWSQDFKTKQTKAQWIQGRVQWCILGSFLDTVKSHFPKMKCCNLTKWLPYTSFLITCLLGFYCSPILNWREANVIATKQNLQSYFVFRVDVLSSFF